MGASAQCWLGGFSEVASATRKKRSKLKVFYCSGTAREILAVRIDEKTMVRIIWYTVRIRQGYLPRLR